MSRGRSPGVEDRRRRAEDASDPVARYRDVIPEWDAFKATLDRPEPVTLRLRGGEHRRRTTFENLRSAGFDLHPVDGMEPYVRVREPSRSISTTLEHWLGDFYIQQVVMGLPALALGTRSGERILDLCAAPGGKTSHLSDLVGDGGIVVASDADDKRLRALLGNVYRLGQRNVLVMQSDGRDFPGGAEFDRVLVDAPCSAEGNLRRRGRARRRSGSFTRHVTGVQRALLERALALVRPGGDVLYATCTFAPEENEGVVDAVLREVPASVVPIELDVPHAPGLEEFEDLRFDSRLSAAWRVYPHHLDSGGLFMVRLRKDGSPADPERRTRDGWHPVPASFDTDGKPGSTDGTAQRATEEAEEAAVRRIEAVRDGLAELFDLDGGAIGGLRWMVRGKSVWVHTCRSWPIPAWRGGGGWRVLSLGCRASKPDPRTTLGERPTSDLLRSLDSAVRARAVDLDRETLLRILAGEAVHAVPASGPERGFVALRHRGRVLGRGWVGAGTVRSEVAKARARRLLRFIGSEEDDRK